MVTAARYDVGMTETRERPALVAWRNRRMFEAAARKPRNRAKYTRKDTAWRRNQ